MKKGFVHVEIQPGVWAHISEKEARALGLWEPSPLPGKEEENEEKMLPQVQNKMLPKVQNKGAR